MKRFVTYLYECQRGNKSRNVGFIRINVRGEETTMEVYIRNLVRTVDNGRMLALIYKEQMHGIELGEIQIENGKCDCHIQVQTSDICETGFSIHDIEGVGIYLSSGLYIASCWKDEYAEEIVRGEYSFEKKMIEEEMNYGMQAELVTAQESKIQEDEMYSPDLTKKVYEKDSTLYEKIDLSQIRDLPSPNWHLATNSFLIHGYWNYGYLVLKKDVEEGQKKFSLGVPGIYERPEAVMAVLFGFPNFEVVSKEIIDEQKEKNQETKDGTFGYWFVNLKM